jgi:hypothetical protein
MRHLVAQLKKDHPVPEHLVIQSVTGARAQGHLSESAVRAVVQEVLDFIPPDVVRRLPKLQIEVKKLKSLGSYGRNGLVSLSNSLGPDKARSTIYHEMMHWLHMDGPNQAFRDEIRDHFAARTLGETRQHLSGYSRKCMGKKDRWYEIYAGRIYQDEAQAPQGLEVPTRYFEWMTWEPRKQADHWNIPEFRDTLQIVLKHLF